MKAGATESKRSQSSSESLAGLSGLGKVVTVYQAAAEEGSRRSRWARGQDCADLHYKLDKVKLSA
jgi:hypothetical protein